MEKRPFDEKTMREFKSVKDALKVYGEEKIPRKRIVWLFQESNEIRFANISVNATYLQQLSKAEAQKFIVKLCGKNESKVKAFEKALAVWKAKFEPIRDVKEPIREAVDKKIAEEKLAMEKATSTQSDSELNP
jgi:hypothetical protein